MANKKASEFSQKSFASIADLALGLELQADGTFVNKLLPATASHKALQGAGTCYGDGLNGSYKDPFGDRCEHCKAGTNAFAFDYANYGMTEVPLHIVPDASFACDSGDAKLEIFLLSLDNFINSSIGYNSDSGWSVGTLLATLTKAGGTILLPEINAISNSVLHFRASLSIWQNGLGFSSASNYPGQYLPCFDLLENNVIKLYRPFVS